VPLLVLSAAGIAAAAFTPILVRDAPLGLLLLESRNRYLLAVAGRVAFWPFVVVGVLRRLASDPFYYLLGRWYGDRAVRWVEETTGGASKWTGHGRRWFARLADLAVFAFPGALVCALAGASGMRPRRFLTLNLLGSVAIVLLLRRLAAVWAEPIAAIVDFNDRNAVGLTAVFVVVTALALLPRRRGTVTELRDRLEGDEPG
jgi:membrane protein DedA with SNARE-associated domain